MPAETAPDSSKAIPSGHYATRERNGVRKELLNDAADAEALAVSLTQFAIAAENVRRRLHLMGASVLESLQPSLNLLAAVTTVASTAELADYRTRLETTAQSIRKEYGEEVGNVH